jgi:hypothetical protein
MMDQDYAESAELEQRVSGAGWHIVRDAEIPGGYAVEFQQAPYSEFVPDAPTRTVEGSDRNDAIRRFLAGLTAEQPAR